MSKRARNGGHFKRGPDPRRHQLTRDERAAGGRESYKRLMAGQHKAGNIKIIAFVYRKIRSYYRQERKADQ